MKTLFTLFAAFLMTALPSHAPVTAHESESHDHKLTIDQPWAPHTGRRTMSAAVYFSVHNASAKADALVAVKTDVAEMAMLHRSYEEDGIMRMDHVEALDIPAGGTAALEPGSYHIMLMRLKAPLKRGDYFPLTLVFEKAGDVTTMVEITGIGGPE